MEMHWIRNQCDEGGMEWKERWGTVSQVDAGDRLSGFIINPNPLLFNILKTHTLRTDLLPPASAPSERNREYAMIN